MSDSMDDRVLALAGLLQSLSQVRRIADTGQAERRTVQPVLDSVFRIEADSAEAVYGDAGNLRGGLSQLREFLARGSRDEGLGKLALAVLRLERRFVRDEPMTRKVQASLRSLAGDAARQGSDDGEVVEAVARLYSETISNLRPRVMVQGNPHYLGQPGIVAEIRALLLAALRSAVLWRQMGGSLWDFVFRRRDMAAAIDARLG